MIGTFNVADNAAITSSMFASSGMDADGIFYDANSDKLYQLDRTNNVVNEYSMTLGGTPTVSATSTSDFTNGREIAVFGNKIVVTQSGNTGNNEQNKLFVYTIGNGTITLDKTFDVGIQLWGIHANGNTLFAIRDQTNEIAIFENFFASAAGLLVPTQIAPIEGLVRTHGLTYDADEDYMIFTDIGDAASDSDGALVVVPNFTTAVATGGITPNEQIRVSGGASKLGNPVDVAYNSNDGRIYVAERANSGGLILGFKKPALSGGIAPAFQMEFAGASAVNFSCAGGADPCEFIEGGTVAFDGGGTTQTIFVDMVADVLSFTSTVENNPDYNFSYIVTDANGMILGIPSGNSNDFDPAGPGSCNVYGVSYTGMLTVGMGDDLFGTGVMISDGCSALSSNKLTVIRVMPQTPDAYVFASSNTSGQIGVVGILPDGNASMNMFNSQGDDADGIYFDEANDVLYQLNRSANVVNVYSGVSTAAANGTQPTLAATSTSDFTNGREIAVFGDKLVVAQSGNDANGNTNKLVVYSLGMNTITLDRTFDVSIQLWGIHIDGGNLYAIVDGTNELAVYNNILGNAVSGALDADQTITVENLVRTHGLTYISDEDLMILTDIGNAGSATDGALVVVRNFSTKISDNNISASEQVRVSGAASKLGNPVDVAYDTGSKKIYVAERANGGGMILTFNTPVASGGVAPSAAKSFAGASAVNIAGSQGDPCSIVDGGTVALALGGTQATVVVDNMNPTILSFNSSVPTANNYSFTYVVTDANGMVLGVPMGNLADFSGAGGGACNVYGLTYTGTLNVTMGTDLLNATLSTGCFDLSSNKITVNRFEAPQTVEETFFASSNTSGLIGLISVLANGSTTLDTTSSQGADADGIYFDQANDILYQLNRSANVVNAYSGVNMAIANGTAPTLVATSTSDFTNGREIAVFGDKLVVAQSGNTGNGNANKLVIYTLGMNSITLDKTVDVNIQLWGIQLEGADLLAIEDGTNNLAIFNNILGNATGSADADQVISVENLVRTHGLVYDGDEDLLILTDIGDAGSATDGALVIVKSFSTKIGDDMISMSEQIRVGGGSSKLGNPVDVAYDADEERIYVAERANSGGLILGFNVPVLSGGISPISETGFAGASAVNIGTMQNDACDFVEGGTVSLTSGATTTTIFIDGSGDPNVLTFNSSVPTATNYSFRYIITDAAGMVLGTPPANSANFTPAGVGACNVYGLTFTGTFNVMMGDDLFAPGAMLSSACFDLSDNNIVVNRIAPEAISTQLFASSNNSGLVGVFGVLADGNNATLNTFASAGVDADGIFYDDDMDILYQLNRTENRVDVYTGVSAAIAGNTMPTLAASSTSDFSNGREIAVAGNKLIVAQDASTSNGNINKLVVYTIGNGTITLDRTFNVNINLWGIHLVGNTLIAIQDNSQNVAFFENIFSNADGTTVEADETVLIVDMGRTHGLTYDEDEDVLILTDIGDAGNASDGALVIIQNFSTKIADNTIIRAEQIRVSGGGSQLGNPVDVAYDADTKMIFVAERAKNGGMILGFRFPALSGGISPAFANNFAGASAVNITGSQGDECELVEGGTVELENGGTETTIIIDMEDDFISFTSNVSGSTVDTFTYVVTDAAGIILGIPPGNTVNFNGAGIGVCNVYGLSYTGTLNIEMGDDLFGPGNISEGCFDLSENSLTINRIAPVTIDARLYASSNTSGTIGVLGLINESSATMQMFNSQDVDADGIYYNAATDMLYQLNRTNNVIDVYSNVMTNLNAGTAPTYMMSSTSDFTNGREIAAMGDKLVVADDAAQNRLVVYDLAGGGIALDASYDVSINLWGIQAAGDNLIAIVDNSNQVAIFNNFLANTTGTAITADQTVSVSGLVRTHGLAYNSTEDYMILTDIGDAGSAGDGALVTIKNFMTASADDNISSAEQVRVSGGASQLGNPVDVEYDASTQLIYVAERANGGGKILGFRKPAATGGIAPVYVKVFAGASAISLNAPNSSMLNQPQTNAFVQSNTTTVTLADLYPNPARDEVNVVIEVEADLNSIIRIFDNNGSLIKTLDVELIKGENQIQIDLSNVASGMLFFNIPELGKTVRFIKM